MGESEADSTVSKFAEYDEPIEDILEKRIFEIEKKFFGPEGKVPQSLKPETSIVDSLAHINTLVSSALSGREKLNALIQRLPELENYGKTDFEPVDLQMDLKLEYILAMEPEIRENARRFKQLQELLPILESDRFNNLPEMSEKLHVLTLKYVELGDKTEKINSETRDMVSKYNDIITNISKILISIDAEMDNLEKEAEPKKVVD